MADLLGFVSIGLVSLMTILIGLRWSDISKIIYIALSVRIIFIFIGHYIVPLPDSTQDAMGFQELAWSYGKNGFYDALNNFPGINSFFYSWIIGVLYSLLGRSILMAQSLSLLFGILSIFIAWLFTKKLWDNQTANKVGWVLALFPSLILYSTLPLREVFQSFFLLIAVIGIYYWVRDYSNRYIFLALFGFIGATFFHGPLIFGGIVFLLIVFFINFQKMINSILSLRLDINAFVFSLVVIFILQYFFLNKIFIPKIGYFEDLNLGYILRELNARMIGQSSYGDWAIINSDSTLFEIFYKSILRIIYFLFSPFPWDVQKPAHIIGMMDGFLYLFLFYLMICNRKIIWNDIFLRITFIILLTYFFIFAIGVSNFGAGLRHRSKFVIEIILLTAPLIPSSIYFHKKKIKKFLKKKVKF